MARDSEMQEFTRSLFRGRPDLSTLTHSIVRQRFLAHVGRDHLEPEEKQALKRLVEEELLKMQVDEAGNREKLDLTKKVKRPPTPSSDPERKRFRFNSESELGSAASSPDSFGSPAKNGMAAAEASSSEKSPKRAPENAMEESRDEGEQPGNLTAKLGLEESSEEEEEKEFQDKTRKKTVTKKNKQTSSKASASRKQAREESEGSEDEPAPRMGRKGQGKRGAKSHQESEEDSEGEQEESPAEQKGSEEEGEGGEEAAEEQERKHKAMSNTGKRFAWEKNFKQKSRTERLTGDWGDRGEEKEEEAAGSGDNMGGDEKPPVKRKSKDRTQCEGGEGPSGSSEDGEDSWRKVKLRNKGSRKAAEVDSTAEESDLEREVSDSEAGGSPKEERKNRSPKKSSKKGKTRSSSSSSSDGSPEPKGRKAAAGRRGEDHPAVMRLKRYIRACGAYRNYKKLLGACHSHKERLSVLRAELEALGMKGNPSLEKCRALKAQREEAAEVASLDVANIISSSGRPRRRTAWNPSGEAASSGEPYRRTLDSEEERPHPPPPDWSHMHGIISSDGESN
ncbi:HIRA-interacting protein 3 [Orycteropus afer afer]|uniref:HIRA-interacting protein 3 n=1 Tax=Orycteropus afer afer TaxID=1230840 RepID=A0A8B7AKM4_ORYAF|nr:HIRA-interacting protein 3 [Orycteropus afer afer]